MRAISIFLLSCCLSHTLWAKTPVGSDIAFDKNSANLLFADEQLFDFHGKIDVNRNSVAGGGMAYPADTAGVFFAAILTHAAIAGSARKAKLNAAQKAADEVLADYQPHIEKINAASMQFDQLKLAPDHTFNVNVTPEADPASQWSVRTKPVFFLTQSQQTLILYHQLMFYDLSLVTDKKSRKVKKTSKRKKKGPDPRERLIVIVSDPLGEGEASQFWLNEEGKYFQETVRKLYQESMQIGFQHYHGYLTPAAPNQMTIRYLEDGKKKIERGQVIKESCRRTMFLTLAGEIKLVPNMGFANCAPEEPDLLAIN
jgi:hypothetical protein